MEELLRPFLVFRANVGMPAVDKVELNGDLIAGAHGEAALVEDFGEGLTRIQDPAGIWGVVQIEDRPGVVGEDDVDVETACDTV